MVLAELSLGYVRAFRIYYKAWHLADYQSHSSVSMWAP